MGTKVQPALTLFILVASLLRAQPAAAVQGLTEWHSGILTHYGGKQDHMNPSDPSFGSKEGSCGYGQIPKDRWPYFSVAALSANSSFYLADPLHGCGQCFQIQCVSGMDSYHKDSCIKDSKGVAKSILVVITDECPECEAEHLDVQSLSFAKLADPSLGRLKISYRRIECTPPEDMKVSVMDFVGSKGWLRLAIDDTGGRGSVTQVYVKSSEAQDWIAMQNTWGAAWELSKAPSPPLDFKMETDDGEEVVAMGVIKQNGGISQGAYGPRQKFDTGVQFTITDPAASMVRAAAGPDENSDPMVATSDTPGNDNSLAPKNASARLPPAPSNKTVSSLSTPAPHSPPCVDVPAPGNLSCTQLKNMGKCEASNIVDGGYCTLTCGMCQPSFSDVLAKMAKPAGGGSSQPPNSNAVSWGLPLEAPASEPLPAGKSSATPQAAQKPAAPASELAFPLPPSAPPPPAPCIDIQPPGDFTCQEQKKFNKCDAQYLQHYCALTCSRCTGVNAATAGKSALDAPAPTPAPQSENVKGPTAPAPSRESANPLASQPAPTPANYPAPAPVTPACADALPPGTYTCQEQKAFGKCDSPFMQPYCAATCGRCPPQEPAVQSFSERPSQPRDRRLLASPQA